MWKSAIARGMRRLRVPGGVDSLIARWETVRGFGARRYFRNANPAFGVPPTMLAYDAYGRWDPECPSGKSRGSVRRVFAAPGASREGALRTSETCPDVPASGRRFLLPSTKKSSPALNRETFRTDTETYRRQRMAHAGDITGMVAQP